MRKHLLRLAAILLVLLLALGWWLFSPDRAELPEDAVTGAQPRLSRAREQTIPTVRIAKPIGWSGNALPTPARGLRVQPFARGLDHPRWLYRLANGDVLVAESNSPPREGGGLKGWVMKLFMGRAGAGVPSANRITLLRDADGDGVAEQRSALLTGLNSPFGMAVVGDWLYVANTDARWCASHSAWGRRASPRMQRRSWTCRAGATTGRATSWRTLKGRRCS